MKKVTRCDWAERGNALMQKYHDEEWGVPLYDDKKIFEFLVLESFQAGLSWRVVLEKREYFRKAFAGFDPKKVARFTQRDIATLLKNEGLIRNHAKIEAAINNAQRFLEVQKEFGAFSSYMWAVVGGKPVVRSVAKLSDHISVNIEAIGWAKDLKKRGFKFLGPTTLYAHMQATGMVNDHMVKCFRKRIG